MPLPQSSPTPDGETQKLRQQLSELTAEAIHNEETFKRCHDREVSLLSAEGLPQLLDTLTKGMQASFSLHCIHLVLDDQDHELRHLLLNSGNSPENFQFVTFSDQIEKYSPVYHQLNMPWLGSYDSDNHQALFYGCGRIRSIALLPMIRRDSLVGVLHLGSDDPFRFTRHHASHFLQRLATIGAFCLESAANREHLVISGLTDVLTGLHNRRYLDGRLEEEVSRAKRYGNPLSCLFIDADHFKRVNDHHGHHAGDRVLREISLRVRECLRASDVATRFGGEEFALLLPQTGREEAFNLAERIRSQVWGYPILLESGEELRISVSIGVSQLSQTDPHQTGEQLLSDADSALYKAKRMGRNQVRAALPA
ncbi:MAG: sensor domain-containing diguanylate cyclase [Gammaproteobacteria bacterium]|nr:sensor domain-containing diguanylate cyclase [Gammaproteobacteria bacterium]